MKPVLACFGTGKGGASKSTLTVMMANYIHHLSGDYRVCVVDCDDKQQTIQKLRGRDRAVVDDTAFDFYNVESINSSDFPVKWLQMDTEYFENFDFVFIDLPGSLKQKGVIQCFSLLDVLFIPFNLNQAEIDSTVTFLTEYAEVEKAREMSGFSLTERWMLLARIDRRTMEAKRLEELKSQIGLRFLENYFPLKPASLGRDLKTYLNGADDIDKETKKLCEEIFGHLKKKHAEFNPS